MKSFSTSFKIQFVRDCKWIFRSAYKGSPLFRSSYRKSGRTVKAGNALRVSLAQLTVIMGVPILVVMIAFGALGNGFKALDEIVTAKTA